nr:hypothetical protein CFP56_28841 [Quercus suber]
MQRRPKVTRQSSAGRMGGAGRCGCLDAFRANLRREGAPHVCAPPKFSLAPIVATWVLPGDKVSCSSRPQASSQHNAPGDTFCQFKMALDSKATRLPKRNGHLVKATVAHLGLYSGTPGAGGLAKCCTFSCTLLRHRSVLLRKRLAVSRAIYLLESAGCKTGLRYHIERLPWKCTSGRPTVHAQFPSFSFPRQRQ